MRNSEPLNPENTLGSTSAEGGVLNAQRLVAGRFRLLQRLGEGTFGDVWRARDEAMNGRAVAVKLQRRADVTNKAANRHFKREIRALENLRHASIAQVLQHGEHEGALFLVRELSEGAPLDRWVSSMDQRISPDLVGQVFEQVLCAVGHAHQRGVYHLDLKPANILITQGPSGEPIVHVVDFGLARLAEFSGYTTSSAGSGEGTLPYMAPEQLAGPRQKLGPRADVFSLGVLLVEIITGSPLTPEGGLWSGASQLKPTDMWRAQSGHRFTPPQVVWEVLLRALHRDPAGRYANATEFRHALYSAWPKTNGNTRLFGPPSRTSSLVTALLALVIVVVLGLYLTDGVHPECVEPAIVQLLGTDAADEPLPVVLPLHSPDLPTADCPRGNECVLKGIAYEYGQGVPHDFLIAAAHYQRGCDMNDGWGCNRLGLLFDYGLGVLPDQVMAQTLFERACTLGYIRGCVNAATVGSTMFGDRFTVYSLACDMGEWLGCWKLAKIHWYGDDVAPRNRQLARQLAAQAMRAAQERCDAGEIVVCYLIAHEYCTECGTGSMDDAGRISWLLDPDNARSVRLFARACDAGELQACADLAESYQRGGGAPQGNAAESALLEKSCQGGVMLACGRLAWRYRVGKGVPLDKHRAAMLISHACAGGDLDQCVALGNYLHDGVGTPKTVEKAARLFDFACRRGESSGCVRIADLLLEGEGDFVPRDTSTARQWFRHACDEGSSEACGRLVCAHHEGTWVERNFGRAAEIERARCDAGEWGFCRALAWLFVKGEGVPKDVPRALVMLENLCEADVGEGCSELGVMFQHGYGVPRDSVRAARYLRTACELDHASSCYNLAPMYQSGDGVPREPTTAQSLYDKACRLGSELACAAANPKDPCQSTGVFSF